MTFKLIDPVCKIADAYNIEYDVAKAYYRYTIKASNKSRRDGRTCYKDSTRQKTYDAENRFMRAQGWGEVFVTVEDAQRFADKVYRSAVWEKHKTSRVSPTAPKIEYSNNLNGCSGVAYRDRIVLARTGMNMYILLHELAHTNGHRHHDFSFRRCLVDLVTRFMGKEKGDHLKRCFKDAGLKMSVRNVGQVKDFTEWFKTYERMEKARAARAA